MDAVILGVRGVLTPEIAPIEQGSSSPSMGHLRTTLREIVSHMPLVLLERGPFDALEEWAKATGVADIATFRLWSNRLGRQANPPSRLPFRFIHRRIDVAPRQCLYAGCDEATLFAAERAGCCTWDIRLAAPKNVPDDVVDLVDWLRTQSPFRLEA